MRQKRLVQVLLLTLLSVFDIKAQPAQAPCTPGISFWKLLDAVGIAYSDSRLNINNPVLLRPHLAPVPGADFFADVVR